MSVQIVLFDGFGDIQNNLHGANSTSEMQAKQIRSNIRFPKRQTTLLSFFSKGSKLFLVNRWRVLFWSAEMYSKYTLFFYKNIVFSGQAEYSYFSADFRL